MRGMNSGRKSIGCFDEIGSSPSGSSSCSLSVSMKPCRRSPPGARRDHHAEHKNDCLSQWSTITWNYDCLRQEPRRMEKTVEGGDPEKCQMDHQPSVIGGHPRFCCRSKPTHAKCAGDGNGHMPRDRRLANEDAGSGHDIHNAPESHRGRKGGDEMRTDLTKTRIVRVEWVLRCQH